MHSINRDVRKWNRWRESNLDIVIHLEGAILNDAELNGVNFQGAKLEKAHLKRANLESAHLEGAGLHEAVLVEVNLHESHLEGTDIHHANLKGSNLRNIWISKDTNCEDTLFGDAVISIHKECRTDEKDLVMVLAKAEVNNVRFIDPVFGRKVRDEAWLFHFEENCKKKWYKRIGFWLWKASSDCGRSIFRWAAWSMTFAFLFAWKFFCLGPEAFAISILDFSFETMLYYSVVTFTTLGFGDVTPTTVEASRWVMVEVILGYLMLGGLISIFANKLARRND